MNCLKQRNELFSSFEFVINDFETHGITDKVNVKLIQHIINNIYLFKPVIYFFQNSEKLFITILY